MLNINTWAENLTQEIYSEYKSKYFFWKHGIKVFYSPVTLNPRLMIISYQPGGTEKHFEDEDKNLFENGDFRVQNFNSYSETNHAIARRVRNFFDFAGGLELLKSSVVFPLIFFRAPTISAWRKEIPGRTRLEMEAFCFSKVKEIIEKLQPQEILVLGIETYDRLKDILGSVKNETILHVHQTSGRRMVIRAETGGHKLFAIIHPSGARVSTADWEVIRKLFEKEIATF